MTISHKISIAFQTDKTASEYIELAQLVDHYAFDTISVYCDLPFHPPYAPLMLMAPYLRTARVGVAANSPFRIHPLDIAAQTALLADIAHSGVYAGIARGAWLAEHGVPEPKSPLKAIREAVEVIRYMLEGKQGGYHGEIYRIAPHVRAPYPIPSATIPILIGTWGQQLCALAGEIADEVKIGGSANPDVVPVIQSYITRGEIKAHRPSGQVGVVVGAVSVVDDDREQARALARRAVALYLPVVAPLDPTIEMDPKFVQRLNHLNQQNRPDDAAALISDSLLEKFALAGNPDDLIRQTELLFESGAHRVEFGTPHGIDPRKGIRLLGERVLPALEHRRRPSA